MHRVLKQARRSAETSAAIVCALPLRSGSAGFLISRPQRSLGRAESAPSRTLQPVQLRSAAASKSALPPSACWLSAVHRRFGQAQFEVPLRPHRGALGGVGLQRVVRGPQRRAIGSHLAAVALPARALPPNPSLERTPTGRAGWPRSGQWHHPLRGQPALPAGAAQLKR